MVMETYIQPTVIRNNRGLSIQGTRITLYQIMDYLKEGAPHNIIRDDFSLTVKQTDEILSYIHDNYNEIESEYNRIVDKSEEERRYWSDRNKNRFEKIGKLQMKSEFELIKSKLKSRQAFK